MITRLWLEPWVNIHPAAAQAISQFDAAVIGPGSFYTSLMPIFLVRGAPEAIQQVKGPVVLVCNLLTEGRGMWHFTAGEAVREMAALIGRPIDVVLINTSRPSEEILARYREEHKRPLAVGDVPETLRGRDRRLLAREESPATTADVSRTPSGRSSRGGCSDVRRACHVQRPDVPAPGSRSPRAVARRTCARSTSHAVHGTCTSHSHVARCT